ncbi:DedA family protein [candidate division KSB1 bacterium]|nr:DedA family protein [candidate division KSB1 bacterium]
MDDTFGQLLQRFGYLAIGIGTFLEGETILIFASIFAVQGSLQLGWVIFAAALGAFVGDVGAYFLGFYNVDFLFKKSAVLRRFYPKAKSYFRRYGLISVLIARFLYGVRLPTGIFCGMTRLKIWRFLLVSFAGCALWAALWCGLGFSFGHSLSLLVEDIQRFQKYIFGGILVIAIAVSLIRRLRTNAKILPEAMPLTRQKIHSAEMPMEQLVD